MEFLFGFSSSSPGFLFGFSWVSLRVVRDLSCAWLILFRSLPGTCLEKGTMFPEKYRTCSATVYNGPALAGTEKQRNRITEKCTTDEYSIDRKNLPMLQ